MSLYDKLKSAYPSPMITLGTRFHCKDGQVIVAVDKFQTKQTRGYWVAGISGATEMLKLNTWKELAWPVSDHYISVADKKHAEDQSKSRGHVLLCAANELDEQENEFGIITP